VTVQRLRRDTVLDLTEPVVSMRSRVGAATLPGLSAGVRAALGALGAGDRTEIEVTELVTAQDGPAGLFKWHMLARRLDAAGWLEHAVVAGGTTLARLRPVGVGPRGGPHRLPADVAVRLSRFAVVRVEDGGLVVQAPGSHAQVELAGSASGLLGALAGGGTVSELAASVPALDASAVATVTALLADARVLLVGDAVDEGAPASWSPTDVWMHERSRGPKLSAGYGGTYSDGSGTPPLPAARPTWDGLRRELTVPDLDVRAKTDPSLTTVLEGRRSGRRHDDTPMTVDELGELLYRTARQRRMFVGSDGQEVADRPYPSGGAVHELEVYPLITSCAGIEPGLWHYAAAEHALYRVTEPTPETAQLVAGARGSAMMSTDPQVVFIVAARFGRVRWKYETIAYALTLKHVGVFYQTVYLAAAAMGLAACGLGGGDARTFAAASGLDAFVEGSVGEMIIGSAPPADPELDGGW
jgi:SagB-type dehydrogenase family enzyme